jgi:hypothetical protein
MRKAKRPRRAKRAPKPPPGMSAAMAAAIRRHLGLSSYLHSTKRWNRLMDQYARGEI